MTDIDLRKYGLAWKVEPTKSFSAVPADYKVKLNKITEKAGEDRFTTQVGNTYKKGAFIGGGTFGKVYDCTRESDGKKVVMKVIEGQNVYSVIKESIIQIIIVEQTRGLSHPEIGLTGPYAPEFYEFAYDPTKNICYLFSEQMRNTTFALIKSRKGYVAETKQTFITLLTQIPVMLKDLWSLVKFNHRDFKTDNCMYIKDATGKYQMRLIDFGFSCMEIGNIRLDGGGYTFNHCSLPTRDLTQYLFEIYKYHGDVFGADQKDILEKLLTFPLGKKACYMYKECTNMKVWKDTYKFLNSTSVPNPNGDPQVIYDVIMAYSKGEDWSAKLAYVPAVTKVKTATVKRPTAVTGKPPIVPKKTAAVPEAVPEAVPAVVPVAVPAVEKKPAVATRKKKCVPGTIRNPDSGRCVSSTGEIGRKLMRTLPYEEARAACPKGAPDLNPESRRCVPVCPDGKERSSKTFRCVSKKAPKAKAVKAVCEAGKERNPLTGRCVLKCKRGYKRDAAFKCRSTRKVGRPALKTKGKTMKGR